MKNSHFFSSNKSLLSFGFLLLLELQMVLGDINILSPLTQSILTNTKYNMNLPPSTTSTASNLFHFLTSG